MKVLLCSIGDKPDNCENCKFMRYHLMDNMQQSRLCLVNDSIECDEDMLYESCPLLEVDLRKLVTVVAK